MSETDKNDTELTQKIVELRRARWTFPDIAHHLDIPLHDAYDRYALELYDRPVPMADVYRIEHVEMADDAVRNLLAIAKHPKVSARTAIEAWRCIETWQTRQARLLGLDAPQRHEVVTIDALDATIRALEQQLALEGGTADNRAAGTGRLALPSGPAG